MRKGMITAASLAVLAAAIAAGGMVLWVLWVLSPAQSPRLTGNVRLESIAADVLFLEAPEQLVRRGSRRVVVVRLDGPAELVPQHFTALGLTTAQTIEQWGQRLGTPLVFNAGQFDDKQQHLGWLKGASRWLSRARKPAWMALLVTGPLDDAGPWGSIVDLELASAQVADRYANVVQSMMLVDQGRRVRVRRTDRDACRTVVAEDRRGRILIIVTEGAVTLAELAAFLPEAGLGIVRAMNLDGGVESQLYINAPELQLALYGQYGTGTTVLGQETGTVIRYPLPAVIAWRAPQVRQAAPANVSISVEAESEPATRPDSPEP